MNLTWIDGATGLPTPTQPPVSMQPLTIPGHPGSVAAIPADVPGLGNSAAIQNIADHLYLSGPDRAGQLDDITAMAHLNQAQGIVQTDANSFEVGQTFSIGTNAFGQDRIVSRVLVEFHPAPTVGSPDCVLTIGNGSGQRWHRHRIRGLGSSPEAVNYALLVAAALRENMRRAASGTGAFGMTPGHGGVTFIPLPETPSMQPATQFTARADLATNLDPQSRRVGPPTPGQQGWLPAAPTDYASPALPDPMDPIHAQMANFPNAGVVSGSISAADAADNVRDVTRMIATSTTSNIPATWNLDLRVFSGGRPRNLGTPLRTPTDTHVILPVTVSYDSGAGMFNLSMTGMMHPANRDPRNTPTRTWDTQTFTLPDNAATRAWVSTVAAAMRVNQRRANHQYADAALGAGGAAFIPIPPVPDASIHATPVQARNYAYAQMRDLMTGGNGHIRPQVPAAGALSFGGGPAGGRSVPVNPASSAQPWVTPGPPGSLPPARLRPAALLPSLHISRSDAGQHYFPRVDPGAAVVRFADPNQVGGNASGVASPGRVPSIPVPAQTPSGSDLAIYDTAPILPADGWATQAGDAASVPMAGAPRFRSGQNPIMAGRSVIELASSTVPGLRVVGFFTDDPVAAQPGDPPRARYTVQAFRPDGTLVSTRESRDPHAALTVERTAHRMARYLAQGAPGGGPFYTAAGAAAGSPVAVAPVPARPTLVAGQLVGNQIFDPNQPIAQFADDYVARQAQAGVAPARPASIPLDDQSFTPARAKEYLEQAFPGLTRQGVQNGPHQNNSVVEHTVAGLSGLATDGLRPRDKELLRLAYLFHDIGKLRGGTDSHHQEYSADLARQHLDDFATSAGLTPAERQTVETLIGNHHAFGDLMRGRGRRYQGMDAVARIAGDRRTALLMGRMWETDVRGIPGYKAYEFGAPVLGIPLSRNWGATADALAGQVGDRIDDLTSRNLMDPAKAQAHVQAQQAQQAVATAARVASPAISPGAFAALGAPASASRSSANPATASATATATATAIASGPLPQVAPAGFVQTRATAGSTRPGSPDVAGDTLAFDRILGGSTQAELRTDRVTGLRYVVKQGGLQAGGGGGRRGGAAADPQEQDKHVREEIATDGIYAALGVPVAPSAGYTNRAGLTTKVAKFVTGRSYDTLRGAELASVRAQLSRQFVADALVGNWDVIGNAEQNVILGHDGVAYRIDNGGGLRFRAQGERKRSNDFGAGLKDLFTMRSAVHGISNPTLHAVYDHLTPQDLASQAHALVAAYRANPQGITAALAGADDPAGLRRTLDARVGSLDAYARQVDFHTAAGLSTSDIERETRNWQEDTIRGRNPADPTAAGTPGTPGTPAPSASSPAPAHSGITFPSSGPRDLRPPGMQYGEYVMRSIHLPIGEQNPFFENLDVPMAVHHEARAHPGLNFARAYGMSYDGPTGRVAIVHHGVNTTSRADQQQTLSSILQTGFRQGATTFYGWGGYAVANGSSNVPPDYIVGGSNSAILVGEYHMGRTISSTDAHAGAMTFDARNPAVWRHLNDQQKTAAWALMMGYSSMTLPFQHGGSYSSRVVPALICIDPARFRVMSCQSHVGGAITVRATTPLVVRPLGPSSGGVASAPGFRPAGIRGYAATPEITFPALPPNKLLTPAYAGGPMDPASRPDRYLATVHATMPSRRAAGGQYSGPSPDPTPGLQAVLMPGYRE